VIFEVGIWRIERPARSVGFYLWVDSGETAIEMLGAGIDAWNLRKSFKEATFITGIRTYAEPSAFDLRPWEHSTNPVFPITSDSYRSEDGMIVDITAGKIHITMWEGQIHLDTQSSDILFKDTYGRTFLFSNSVYPTEI
jgi:hypothetical protein